MSKPYSQYTKDELMSMLESLTPGGSEFYHEPETCVRFVKDRQHTAIAATLKRREVEERCNQLLAACQAAHEYLMWLSTKPDDTRPYDYGPARNKLTGQLDAAIAAATGEQ